MAEPRCTFSSSPSIPTRGTTVELHPLLHRGAGPRRTRAPSPGAGRHRLVRGEDPGIPGVIESHGVVLPARRQGPRGPRPARRRDRPARPAPPAPRGDGRRRRDRHDRAADHEQRPIAEPGSPRPWSRSWSPSRRATTRRSTGCVATTTESLEAEAVFRDAVARTEERARRRPPAAAAAPPRPWRTPSGRAESAMERDHPDRRGRRRGGRAAGGHRRGRGRHRRARGPRRRVPSGSPLEALAADVVTAPDADAAPRSRRPELADRFVELHAEVADLEEPPRGRGPWPEYRAAPPRPGPRRSQAAAAALDRPPLDPEDEEALRPAHEAVLEAERKASGLRVPLGAEEAGHRAAPPAGDPRPGAASRRGAPT